LDLLAAGYRNGELARALAVSDPRACQIKDSLADAVREFFGVGDVPIGRRPTVEQSRHPAAPLPPLPTSAGFEMLDVGRPIIKREGETIGRALA